MDTIHELQLRIIKTIVPPKIKQQCKDYNKLFKFCGILPIEEKLKLTLLVEQFSNTKLQVLLMYKHQLRSIYNPKLIIAKTQNMYGDHQNKIIIPELINKLPETLKEDINPKNIKNKLKTYIMNQLI